MILRLCDWQELGIKVRKSDGSVIDPTAADHDEKIVIDLHVGEAYFAQDNNPIGIEETLEIHPHVCLRIKTDEELITPATVFGILSCRYSMSARGLWIANAKIDPLFHDFLRVTVMNATDRTITLRKGDAFCSIYFTRLVGEVTGDYRKTGDLLPQKKTWKRSMEPHFGTVITCGVMILCAIISVMANLYIYRNTKALTQGQQGTTQQAVPPQPMAPTQPSPTPTSPTPRKP